VAPRTTLAETLRWDTATTNETMTTSWTNLVLKGILEVAPVAGCTLLERQTFVAQSDVLPKFDTFRRKMKSE